jgi:Domain of unknown function (DUF1877)
MIDLDYYRMSPADWETVQDVDEDDLYMLLSRKESDAYLNQSWHVVHYLLTDTNELVDRESFSGQVLGKVVTGSSDILIEDFNDNPIVANEPACIFARASVVGAAFPQGNRLKKDELRVLVRLTDLSDEPRNSFRGGLAAQ